MNDCVLWTGYIARDGYGRVNRGGGRSPQLAHRDAWEAAFGTIPAGLELHHVCGNSACVCVTHLALVTPQAHKMIEQANRTHCRRGHDYASHGHTRANGRRYCRACERANWRRRAALRLGS